MEIKLNSDIFISDNLNNLQKNEFGDLILIKKDRIIPQNIRIKESLGMIKITELLTITVLSLKGLYILYKIAKE